jgi:hypothetical protein
MEREMEYNKRVMNKEEEEEKCLCFLSDCS